MTARPAASATSPNAALPADLSPRQRYLIELARAYEGAVQPSEMVNRWQAAVTLNQHVQEQMRGLFDSAPTLYGVIHGEVSRALARDSDRVLWSSMARGAPVTLTLTQVAAESLREDFGAADLNREVSLADESQPGQALVDTAPQLLSRLQALDLKGRYNLAVRDYWAQVAPGQTVSRSDYAVDLRRQLIQTRALLAQACGLLSDAGLGMIQAVLDGADEQARREAGGEVGQVLVSEVAWAGGNGSGVPFKGAWVIHAEAATLEVLFVPGLGNELFEFASRAQLLARMQAWIDSDSSSAWLLWQLLPYHNRSSIYDRQTRRPLLALTYTAITADCLAHSTRASVFTQHSNELISAVMVSPGLQTGDASLLAMDTSGVALSYAQTTEQWRHSVAGLALPEEWVDVVAHMVRRDARWHEDDIAFGSLAATLALRNREEKIAREEHSIVQLLSADELTRDTPRFLDFVSHLEALQAERQASLDCLKGLLAPAAIDNAQLLTSDTAEGSPQRRLIASRHLALLHEGAMQVLQKQLEEAEFTRLTQALKHNLAGYDSRSELRLMAIAVGTAQQAFALAGAFIITSRQALLTPMRAESALLFVPGQEGGLARFKSLALLQAQVVGTLARDPGCSLWMTVALEDQAPARAWIETVSGGAPVGLQLSEIKVGLIEYSVKSQIKAHKKSLQAIGKDLLVIAGADRQSALWLLAQTTATVLQLPEHAAREQAFTALNMQRQARLLKRQRVPWLETEGEAVQAEYARRFLQINESALAVERYVAGHLPPMVDFVAHSLREQFRHDGFGEDLDPLADMVRLPDTVNLIKTLRTPLNLSSEAVPEVELAQVPQGWRTYNLVQLALDNPDLEDPRQALRFKHMQVLQPRWRPRLTLDYLERTLPALDASGAYERKINSVFGVQAVPDPARVGEIPGNEVVHQLMVRTQRQILELELWKASQRGLDNAALVLFGQAISARRAVDLKIGGLDIELGILTYSSDVERYGLTSVTGGRVIHDRVSDRTLVYLPDRPCDQNLVLYPGLEAANAALAAMGNDPAMRAWLARRTEAQEEPAEIELHLADGFGYAPDNWIAAQFGRDVDMAWSLAVERPERLIQWLRLTTRSTARRNLLRSEREQQQRIATMFQWMGLIPGLNLAADIYFIIQSFKVLREADSAYEAARQVLQIGMCLADMITTVASFGGERFLVESGERVLPGPQVQTRLFLQPLKARQAISREGWAARGITPQARPFLHPDFSGYEIHLSPQGASRLGGTYDRGSYLKDGVQFIVQKGKSIQVTRPKNAQALHLQDPRTLRVGPPVRQGATGEWHFAFGYGLRGGIKEAIDILKACGLSQEVAEGLLADYDFPQESGLDVLFALSVQKSGVRPEWASKFRAVRAGAIAGPSGGGQRAASVEASTSTQLQTYEVVPTITAGEAPGGRSLDRVIIGDNDLYVARTSNGDGFYPLYRPDPVQPEHFVECGRLSAAGIYHIEEPVERDYVSIGGRFYEIRFDFHLSRSTLVNPNALDETGPVVLPPATFKRMGQWHFQQVPAALVNHPAELENLVRKLMPEISGAQISHLISRYGRQVNKYLVPELRLARGVAELEEQATQYTLREGLPYTTLIELLDAQVGGLPIPPGLPPYDELQGLMPLDVSDANQLNIRVGVAQRNYLTVLPLSEQESWLASLLRIELTTRTNSVLASSGILVQLMRAILGRKGYEFLGQGTEAVFQRGFFNYVCKGPNGDLYIMTVKLTGDRGKGSLRSAPMNTTRYGVHFSDAWLDAVLGQQLLEHPDSPLITSIRQAHERGRLFKVLISITRAVDLYIFRILLPKDL